nr:MAG TPA: hypothetical protein [Caudoviricetes sp.]
MYFFTHDVIFRFTSQKYLKSGYLKFIRFIFVLLLYIYLIF